MKSTENYSGILLRRSNIFRWIDFLIPSVSYVTLEWIPTYVVLDFATYSAKEDVNFEAKLVPIITTEDSSAALLAGIWKCLKRGSVEKRGI